MYFSWNDKWIVTDKIKVPNCVKQLGTNKLVFLSDGHFQITYQKAS